MTTKSLQQKISEFKTGFSGKDLYKKYTDSTYGIWQIYGEDPNCDFGGNHHTPLLKTVESTLIDAIAYAVELPNFYQWGGGGHLTLIEPIKVDNGRLRAIAEANARKLALTQELREVNAQLKSLGG